jgi:type I restriction enzyme, S subunit
VPLILKIYEAKFDALSKKCDAVAPIMSFPRYPQYKDSGVEWLGEVPGQWKVTALKRGFNVTLGKMLQPESNSPDDELLPYLRAANIQWNGVESTDIKQMWLSKRDRSQLRLEYGDLLVSEGGDVGRSCLWASELEDCYFQNSVNRVRARDGHSNRYLYYWLSTVKDKGYIDVLCNKSTIAHFTAEKVAAVPVPLPTSDEQTQIVAFLDRETAKIDELVAQQRRLMELLKEKRQAVISHAVTQGLNPQAPMKPSGIEWLGDVPAHWEIAPYKRFVDIQNGSDHKHIETDEGYPVLGSGGIFAYASDFMYEGESVLLGRKGTINKPLHMTGRFWTVDTMYWTKILPDASGKFAYYLALTIPFDYYSTNTALPSMTKGALSNHRVARPKLPEQIEIAKFLDTQSAKFDTLTAEAQRAIDLLQERRTALISAAVTGQIDVRKAV